MATYYWVGGNGTWDNSSKTNWAILTGGIGGFGPPTSADAVNFDANSGTSATVSVTNTAASGATTVNKADINLSLSGSPTFSGALTLTSGTLTLNSYVWTSGYVSASNANTRKIDFGTGKFIVTGNAVSIWQTQNATGLTIAGTPVVDATYSGATGSRSIFTTTTSEATAINFNIKAGTDTISGIGTYVKNIDFTGFAGTYTPSGNCTILGNVTYSTGMTVSSATFAHTYAATSGTQKITTNGKTLDYPHTINAPGAVVQLQDNLTIGSGRLCALVAGTLDFSGNNGNWVLSTGLFSTNYANTRSIAFGTGNITITGTGTVWNGGGSSGFSYSGTPTINISNNSATATTVTTGAMTGSQALNFNYTNGTYVLTDTNAVYKNLNFAGFAGTVPNSTRTIYGNLTVVSGATNNAGTNTTTFAGTSGTQQITTNSVTLDYPLTFNGTGGTFAFQDALTQGSARTFTVTNGTVQLKNSATSVVGVFSTSGTTQKYLQSLVAGTKATLSQASGTVNASYLTIKDITATGGATWNALWSNNNVDAGNNSGWVFGDPPVTLSAEYTYALRSFTQPRRF